MHCTVKVANVLGKSRVVAAHKFARCPLKQITPKLAGKRSKLAPYQSYSYRLHRKAHSFNRQKTQTMGRSKEKTSSSGGNISGSGQRKPALTIQRHSDQLRKSSSKAKPSNNQSSGGCRDCGGNHRTSKCQSYSSSSRRHRSRSKSPSNQVAASSRSRNSKPDRSRRRESGSPRDRYHNHHRHQSSSHRHHGSSRRSGTDDHLRSSSTYDRHHRQQSSSRKSGGGGVSDHADGKSSKRRSGSSKKQHSHRRSSRHGGSGSKSADRITPAKQEKKSSAIRDNGAAAKKRDDEDAKMESSEKKASHCQNRSFKLDTQMEDQLQDKNGDDDATFGEPCTPSPSNEDRKHDSDDEEQDAQSSSNYSSSSQSSNHDDFEEPDAPNMTDNLPHHSENEPTFATQATAVGETKALLQAAQPVSALDSHMKDLVANDDKLSSISSLFLSDKDQNQSTGFGQVKQSNQPQKQPALKEDDLDDIDKISSPGRPRTKPKSINSPGMLSQNIDTTSKLLQQLTQQQTSEKKTPVGQSFQQQQSQPQQQLPQQMPHQQHSIPHQIPPQIPLGGQGNHQMNQQPYNNMSGRPQNHQRNQAGQSYGYGGGRMQRYGGGMDGQSNRQSYSRGGNGNRYQNDQRGGYRGNNPQQQFQQHQQQQFFMNQPYQGGYMGANNFQQMPQQQAFQYAQGVMQQMAPPIVPQQQAKGNVNLQGIGDLTNYEESVRRLENTPESLNQKQILRKISLKGAKIDVRLFVGQVPRVWKDENIMNYFKKFGTINEARIIRDKYDGTHRGCAFLKCQSFHEAEDILNNHLPKLKNENGEFTDDPRRQRNNMPLRNGRRQQSSRDLDNSFDEDDKMSEVRVAGRLQVRYADGELERLGIVNLESQEQSKLYCSNISKRLNQDQVTEMFQTFGDVEELYLFRDQSEQFRGSCFIKFMTRKQALKAVLYLNRKGVKDNKYAASLVDTSIDCSNIPEGIPVLDVRFADKKRKENFSLIYQTQQNQQLLNSCQFPQQQQHQKSNQGQLGGGMVPGQFQQPQQMAMGALQGMGFNGNQGISSSTSAHHGSQHHRGNRHQQQHHTPHKQDNHHSNHQPQHQRQGNHDQVNSMATGMNADQSQLSQADQQKQQLMMGPLQVFLKSLLIDPTNQHLFLEYFSQENGGRPYYLDTLTNVSQWNRPDEKKPDGTTVVIQNGIQVNEQMKQWLASAEGQKVVQNFQQSQQQQMHQGGFNDSQQAQFTGSANQTNFDGMAKGAGNQRALNLITQGLYKQGPVGANLFIFHLPNEWSDLDLFYFFNSFELGTIVSVRIMTDKYSGRSKGYGFVSYDNPRSAEDAIRKVNGKQALGKRLKVELKKGGIATHLGGDVSLSKEDTQMIRRNMPDESHDENSNHSLLTSRDQNNNSVQNAWDSHQRHDSNQREPGKRLSFSNSNSKHRSNPAATTTSQEDKMMQQILGSSQTQENDQLAAMTNLIYEGTTTGANTHYADLKTD